MKDGTQFYVYGGRTDHHDYVANHAGWMNFNELLRNINDGMKLMQRIEQYRKCLKEFFDGKESNMSRARATKLGKYKQKYVEASVMSLRFRSKERQEEICRNAFAEVFVNVDKTSQNLKRQS